MKLIFAIALVLAATASSPPPHVGSHHWSYSGKEGPTHWAELDRTFSACASGKTQSPINIETRSVHSAALPSLNFRYGQSALHIVDNGHTVQVNLDPGSSLDIGKDSYQLVQLHFHHPSEERVNGKTAQMVVHLVHRDAKGELAVVAVLLEAGKLNPIVETLWRHLPAKKEVEESPKGVSINPAALIPANHSYFTYTGSLTTPPCSEGVRWVVLKSKQSISRKEIATFAHLYPSDARPLQQLNGREVLTSQ